MGLWSNVTDWLGWTDTATTEAVNQHQREIVESMRSEGRLSSTQYGTLSDLLDHSDAETARSEIDDAVKTGLKEGLFAPFGAAGAVAKNLWNGLTGAVSGVLGASAARLVMTLGLWVGVFFLARWAWRKWGK